ncbi:unnamed protein product [Porites evermanni]|uniref:C-type lectin domain-containing protein n=1 Tax=Porites evermanni TaxID=104178 RepID=A0ABN8SLQ6_9CNID|nr:unnamed protein product [Porites evermanni]
MEVLLIILYRSSGMETQQVRSSKLNGNEIKCVELFRNGWNLTECCKNTDYYICEKPKGPLSCPPDHDEGHLNGLSCYYKHSTLKTWEDAKKDCTASGGNLDIWIDQGNKSKLCGTISKTDNRKTDRDCGQRHAYLCEKPVPVISAQISRSNCSKLLFFSVPTISCYGCENSSSLDECQKNQDDVDCPIPVHYCAKVKYQSITREGKIQTSYRYGCVTKDQCDATYEKIVDCCKGDKCNTTYFSISFPGTSRFQMAAAYWKTRRPLNEVFIV